MSETGDESSGPVEPQFRVRGRVTRFVESSEGAPDDEGVILTVWTLRVEPEGAPERIDTITENSEPAKPPAALEPHPTVVEISGERLIGLISEGDIVEVTGWFYSGILIAERATNHTTQSIAGVPPVPKPVPDPPVPEPPAPEPTPTPTPGNRTWWVVIIIFLLVDALIIIGMLSSGASGNKSSQRPPPHPDTTKMHIAPHHPLPGQVHLTPN